MCVQEFSSECYYPNQRCVYFAYLDSVKYFRPETKTVTGEALRTFVYHEILIGYLDYCKKRGFTSCYIWACPPLKGEDFILYCHPEIQKVPKTDKLREWYLMMLRKAAEENIVVSITNLYNHFFVPPGECKAKVTATRLPYFDGDFWPGAAEDILRNLDLEKRIGHLQRKGKKFVSRRVLKSMRQTDVSGSAAKDILLMKKLGETIFPIREDFIVVQLQLACTHCSDMIISGRQWICNLCKNFQLCDKCHDAEQNLDEMNRHPINSKEKHALTQVEVNDVPLHTEDKDGILDNELFENRQTFLGFCQGNHYQYDTLRRAKHSTMMILYHFHNPAVPAVIATCSICYKDIEAGQGWHCEVCSDYDVCAVCYQKEVVDHNHKLIKHPSMANHKIKNREVRKRKALQMRKLLDVLMHASRCAINHCNYPNCDKIKKLFCHSKYCKTRATGGCGHCKKTWFLLRLHSRNCRRMECPVPRCIDIRNHMKRLQLQVDSRRRAAVTEPVRRQESEVAVYCR